jgi:hypothetical protein
MGAGACPDTGPPGQICTNPVFTLANKAYSLQVPAGKWRVVGFYELAPFGGPFIGPVKTVTVAAGQTATANLTVPYRAPGTVQGTVNVTNVPAAVTIEQLLVLLCPAFDPFTGGTPPIGCVTSSSPPSPTGGSYSVSTLPPGAWTVYPGYFSAFGTTYALKAGVKTTVVSGQTNTVNVTTPFIRPSNGILTGTLSVTGAPSGFAAPLGINACTTKSGTTTCTAQPVFGGNNTYTLPLAAGRWSIQPLYLVPPFFNAIFGSKHTVSVRGGTIKTLNLAEPYVHTGTAIGALHVTGVPAAVTIDQYRVLACPSSAPWTGGLPSIQCVTEFSGATGSGFPLLSGSLAHLARALGVPAGPAPVSQPPFNRYRLPTLTPGSWILYPGYRTVFGSFDTMTGTTVQVTAGVTTTRGLTIAYQPPTEGAVQGTIAVIGAPGQGGVQVAAQACTAPPTPTSCPGEQQAFVGFSTNSYQLPLAPGTWWVSGAAYVYGFTGVQEYLSPAKKIAVSAGTAVTANFTVSIH